MIKSYLKVAIRNLLKHKSYSIINIAGLTIGLASCFIIFQYVMFEKSFDDFHKNEMNLYRVVIEIKEPGEEPGAGAFTGFALAPSIIESIPEVKNAARIHPEYSGAIVSAVNNGEIVFEEEDIFYADPSFLEMFTLPIESGNKTKALTNNQALISKEAAERYFGENDPVGELLKVTGDVEKVYTVAAVFDDLPANSHLEFNMLLPLEDLLKSETYTNEPENGWSWNNFITYIELNADADQDAVDKKMTELYKNFRSEYLQQLNMQANLQAQPIREIHLNDEIDAPNTKMGSYKTVYFFSIIGVVTLFIALINYINLATARSLDRSKEVGVRKVIGAERKQLIIQFLSESALTNIIAAMIAVIAAELLIPVLNNLTNNGLPGINWMSAELWITFSLIFFVCTILAGLYPAFLLSSFKPVSVLKGRRGSFKRELWLRRCLVILQFAASVVLIGGTVIVYNQLSYMRGIDPKLKLDKVITVNGPRVLPEGKNKTDAINTFLNEIKKLPEVKETATSSTLPGQGFNWNGASIRKTEDDPSSSIRGVVTYIDTNFISLYGLELAAGKSFTMPSTEDENAVWEVIANETAVRSLGYPFPVNAVGKMINIGGYDAHLIGVFKDFNWTSAHNARRNIFFGYTDEGEHISINIAGTDLANTIASVEKIYSNLFPGNVFKYAFVEEKFDEQYKNDKDFAILFTLFAGLAIFIASLGLFGLASFATLQRKKEIGIRKVLGASVTEIVALLSKDFLLLIIIAIGIAIPVVYLIMSSWLENFAYRIEIGAIPFIITGISVLIIAFFTVSYQSIRAVLANPVNSLKYE